MARRGSSHFVTTSTDEAASELGHNDVNSLESKLTPELLRALVILKLSSVNIFVDNSEWVRIQLLHVKS